MHEKNVCTENHRVGRGSSAVWVTVNGGDERKIVEQVKGTRQVTVEPGKTYQFILTDAGQQLATTTAKAK